MSSPSFGQTVVQDNNPVSRISNALLGSSINPDLVGLQYLIDSDGPSAPIERKFNLSDIQSVLGSSGSAFKFDVTLSRPGKYLILCREMYIDGSEAQIGNQVTLNLASPPGSPTASILTAATVTVNSSDSNKVDMSGLVIKVALSANNGGSDLKVITLFVKSNGVINSFKYTLSPADILAGFASIGMGSSANAIPSTWLEALPVGGLVKIYASVENDAKLESLIGNIVQIVPTIKPSASVISNVVSASVDSNGNSMLTVNGSVSSDVSELAKWSKLSIVIRRKGDSNWAVSDKMSISKADLSLLNNTFSLPVKQIGGSNLSAFTAYEVASILHTGDCVLPNGSNSIPLNQSDISNVGVGYGGYGQPSNAQQAFELTSGSTISINSAGDLNMNYGIKNRIPLYLNVKFDLVKNGSIVQSATRRQTPSAAATYPFSLPAGQWSKSDVIKIKAEYSTPLLSDVAAIAGVPEVVIYNMEFTVAYPIEASDLPVPRSVTVSQITNCSDEFGGLVSHVSPTPAELLGCNLIRVKYIIANDSDFAQTRSAEYPVSDNEVSENQALFSGDFDTQTALVPKFRYYVKIQYRFLTPGADEPTTTSEPISFIAEEIVYPGVTNASTGPGGQGVVSVGFTNAMAPSNMTNRDYMVYLINEFGEEVANQTIAFVAYETDGTTPKTYAVDFTLAQNLLGQPLIAKIVPTFLKDNKPVKGQAVITNSYTPDKKPVISMISTTMSGSNMVIKAKVVFSGSSTQTVYALAPTANGGFASPMTLTSGMWEVTIPMLSGYDYVGNGIQICAISPQFSVFKRFPDLP